MARTLELAPLVWRAGGHGYVAADTARAAGHRLAGLVDKHSSLLGRDVAWAGCHVVAAEDDLLRYVTAAEDLLGRAGAIALWVGDGRAPRRGDEPKLEVGSRRRLRYSVRVRASSVVGEDAYISPGAVMGGGVTEGELGWGGAGTVVRHGPAVGAESMVGTGAVVLKDFPVGATVVGNPARPIERS